MNTTHLEEILGRFDTSPSVMNELIAYSKERLTWLTRAMMKDEDFLHRWYDTDDVFQNAMIRFEKAIRAIKPATKKDFLQLAARHIRLEIIDLCRHLRSEKSFAKHHYTTDSPMENHSANLPPGEELYDPTLTCLDLHEAIENLPDEEAKKILDLVFYHELTLAAASKMLGISVSTLRRRIRAAFNVLSDQLQSYGTR